MKHLLRQTARFVWLGIITIIPAILLPMITDRVANGIGISIYVLIVIFVTFIIYAVIFYTFKCAQTHETTSENLICNYSKTICNFEKVLETHIKASFRANEVINFHKLTDEYKLAEFELTCNTTDIWLVSYDLLCECSDNLFRHIVQKNLLRGVSYTFFSVDSKISRDRAKKIQNLYDQKRSKGEIKHIFIEPEKFKLIFFMYNFAIYNPYQRPNMKRTIYMCFGENDSTKRSIYRKLDENYPDEICETLMGYINRPQNAVTPC
jgi:hypothetical protein